MWIHKNYLTFIIFFKKKKIFPFEIVLAHPCTW